MLRRLALIAAVFVFVGALLILSALFFGRGGRGFFSPDTLESRSQSEWLLPIADVPLFRGRFTTHRMPIVDFLVKEGYWSPIDKSEPRWLETFQWNEQWKDGESRFHREMSWRGDGWIKWSNENPAMARALWPRMLRMMRERDEAGMHDAALIMCVAPSCLTVKDFEELIAELDPPASGNGYLPALIPFRFP